MIGYRLSLEIYLLAHPDNLFGIDEGVNQRLIAIPAYRKNYTSTACAMIVNRCHGLSDTHELRAAERRAAVHTFLTLRSLSRL